MLRQNIKFALRNVARHKGYTFISLAGLVVGMTFALLVSIWARYECSVDRHHSNLERTHLVAISADSDKFHGDITVGALAPYLKDTYPEVTHTTRYQTLGTVEFEHEGETYVADGHFVDPDFLDIFTPGFLEGTAETALADTYSVVITKRLARRIFGDETAVGNSLMVGDLALPIGAVIEDPPGSSRFQSDFYLSCAINGDSFNQWDVKNLTTFVMLTPEADYRAVSDKIADAYNIHNPHSSPNRQYLFPFGDHYLHGLDGDGRIVYVRLFGFLAGIVLLLACVNYVNLSTARASTRFREIGLKKTLGAGRGQMIAQFLFESCALTVLAGLLSTGLVEALLPGVNQLAGSEAGAGLSWSTLGLVLLLSIATAALAGIYPALYLASLSPAHILRGGTRRSGTGRSKGQKGFRRVLVVAQFAASIILVIGVMGVFGQLNYLQNMNVGFNKDHVAIFHLPPELREHTATLKNEILQSPDIETITVARHSLVVWQTSMGISWEGQDPANVFDVGRNWVDHDYVNTFQIDMVEGRFFSPEFASDRSRAVVINEACVRAMDITDPVGRTITFAPGSSIEETATVVGVIRDHHTESAHTRVRPFAYSPTETGVRMCARINPDNIAGALDFMQTRIGELAPDAKVSFRFYDELTERLYRDERLTGNVMAYVTVVAVFISCLGLFALASFSARQRAREISIRRVLGVSLAGAIGLLSREFVLLVFVAGVIASPVAWYGLQRWLDSFAFQMTLGPQIFVTAIAAAILVALGTVIYQAYRTAARNPAEVLRQE